MVPRDGGGTIQVYPCFGQKSVAKVQFKGCGEALWAS
jgi:hypothetical protein